MNAPVTPRFATLADAAAIAAMSRDLIERGLPWSWTEARVARAIGDRDVNAIVAGAADDLDGFGIMSYREDAHLLLFAVHPARRRRGIGTALYLWLEAVAITAGAPRIVVECRRANVAARNFYGDLGFHESVIARGYYRGLEDAISLEKHLGARGD